MNRQAGPSIVLSVLIVGFFAVALFPAHRVRAPKSSGPDPIAGPVASPQRRAESAASRPPRPDSLVNPPSAPPATPIKTAAMRGHGPGPVGRSQPLSSRAAVGPTILRETSETSIRPAPRGGPIRNVTALPSQPHQPAQAVTVVGSDETIRDVALRVYGTADQAEVLWRANRDALPRRDSPLVPGTLLRTPTLRGTLVNVPAGRGRSEDYNALRK